MYMSVQEMVTLAFALSAPFSAAVSATDAVILLEDHHNDMQKHNPLVFLVALARAGAHHRAHRPVHRKCPSRLHTLSITASLTLVVHARRSRQHSQVWNAVPLALAAASHALARVVFLPTHALAAFASMPHAYPPSFCHPASTRGYAHTHTYAGAYVMHRARSISAPQYLAAGTSASSPSALKLSEAHQQQQQQPEVHPALSEFMCRNRKRRL
jgi:hypothetical protein